MSDVRMTGKRVRDQVFVALAAITASGNSAVFSLGAYSEGLIFLRCTAKSGTSPTLDVKIEVSQDGVNFVQYVAYTQLTDVGHVYKPITNFGKYIRITYTIGGTDTPTFTFSVLGTLKA